MIRWADLFLLADGTDGGGSDWKWRDFFFPFFPPLWEHQRLLGVIIAGFNKALLCILTPLGPFGGIQFNHVTGKRRFCSHRSREGCGILSGIKRPVRPLPVLIQSVGMFLARME